MEWWQLAVYGLVSLCMSVFSSIAGGGGGFIMTPLLIFFGLTPAQAVSTGKFNGLSVTIGALSGMRAIHGKLSKWRIIPVMTLAFIIGLFVPLVIKSLESEAYRIILGVILLLMIPFLIIRKIGLKPHQPGKIKMYGGYALLSFTLFLQGVFSGGLGTLVNVVLMGMLGMTATEANVARRWSQLILNTTIIFGVAFSGLVVWEVLAVGIPTTLIGGYLGGKIALRKGDKFIMDTMIVLMIISALLLIFGFDL